VATGIALLVFLVAVLLPLSASPADAIFAFQAVDPPNLVVTKDGPSNPVLVGATETYTLNVSNTGGAATNVVITDTLPSNVTFNGATFTAGAGSCSEAGGIVTCTVTSLPTGGSVAIDIDVIIDDVIGTQNVPLPALPTENNAIGATTGPAFRTAAWTGNTADLGPFIDVTAAATNITGEAALTFTPTGAFGAVSPYNDLYGLGDPALDTSLQLLFSWDTTPEGLTGPAGDPGSAILVFTFDEPVTDPVLHIDRLGGQGNNIANSSILTLLDGLTLTELGGTPGFDTTATTIERRSNVTTNADIECRPTVTDGTECGTVQINGTVSQVRFRLNAAPGTVEGVGFDGIEFIWDTEPIADVRVQKTASDIVHVGGDTFSYTVTATNDGPNTNNNVVVTDTLPAGVTLTGSTASAGTFAGSTWTVGSMTSGQVETLTLFMQIPPGVTETDFENVATIEGDYVDPATANNRAVAPVYTCPAGTSPNIAGASSDAATDVDLSDNYDQACIEVGASVRVAKISTNGVDTFSFSATNLDDPVSDVTTATAGVAVETGQLMVTTLGSAVALSEAVPANWELLDADCVDDNSAITGTAGTFGALAGSTLTIPPSAVLAGADIVCTFTNELFAEIDLVKTAGAVTSGSFDAGTYTVTYQVTANNTGLGAGSYSFVDTPTAPAGMVVSSVTLSTTDPAATTAPSNGATSASVSAEPIDPSSSEVWDVTVVYDITAPALVVGGSGTCNEATGTGGFANSIAGDDDASNNDSCVDVPADPALSIEKPAPAFTTDADSSGDISAGDTLTYTITATNDGPSTLTGVVVTDNLITPTGGTTPCASVAPGATCTLVGTYVVTPADVAAGSFTNEATADSDQTDPVTDDEVTLLNAPALDVDKPAPVNADEDGSGDVSAGDTLTYTITATNSGGANLTNVVVTDDLVTATGGTTPCALLLPTETCTLVGTYTVTAADVAAGSITNEATTDSDQTDPVTDDEITPVPSPSLTADKPAPVNADEDGSGDVSAGDTLTYTITATNNGASNLTNVIVTDDLVTPTGGTTPCALLLPTETCTLVGTYTVTAADVAAGSITNEATTDSDQTDPVTDDEITPVPSPSLTADKPAPINADEDGSGDVSAGDTLTYTITATNNGASNLTNVIVTDDLITPTGGTTPCALLLPTETCTLVGTYVVTAADIAAGSVTNEATTDSDQTDPVTDDEITPVPSPSLEIDKPAPINADEDGSGDVSEGDTLTYTITASNNGASNLTNVILTDDLITPTGGTTPCALVAPAGTCTLVGTYVVTAADIAAGDITNEATADSDQTDPVTDDEVTLLETPDLMVDKPAPANSDEDGSGDVSEGDTLTYSITATNTGASNLTNVIVTDDLITPTGGTTPCALLLPTETCTLVGTYVVTAADVAAGSITNEATADSDQTDPVTDDEVTLLNAPVLDVDKPAPVNADEDGSGDVSAGDTLTYTITATNSGGANLTNVVVTDDLVTATGGTTPCALLLPTETCTLVGTYTVTAADVAAGSITNEATADSDQTDPVTDDEITPVPSPSLTADKPAPVNADEDGSGDVSAGDTLTYTITATNNGASNLTNVVVTDDLVTPTGGTTPCALLLPTETCTLVGTYTVTAADVAAGSITNEATADSDQTDPVTDDEITPVPSPSLTADKPAPVNADEDGSGDVSAGDTLTYTITATNNGASNLTNVVVTDDLVTPTGGTTPCALLLPTETCTLVGTYTVTAADVAAGSITNEATADSDQTDPVTDDEITPVDAPALGVDKPAPINADEDGSGDVSEGDTLTYTITATNTGASNLTNVVVTDDLITPTGGTTPCALLLPTETCTLVGTYTVTAADVGAGSVTNEATADSAQTGPVTDDEVTTIPSPLLGIDKPAPANADEDGSGDVSEGDTLTYTITATNTGASNLTNVVVTDDLITPTGGSTPCALLLPSETCTLIGTYAVTAADVTAGSITNEATADSTQTDPVTGDEVTPVPAPALSIDKPAPVNSDEDGSGDVSEGDTLTYTITASNDGDANLTNVIVTDDLITPTGGTTPCALVAPTETCTLVGTYTVTAADIAAGSITNTATTDSDQTDSFTDDDVTTLETPALSIDKPAPVNSDEDGSGDVSEGDTLTYTITATNTGATNLTDVLVTDDLITPTGGTTPCALVAPTETCTLVGTYTVTAADIAAGSITNTATADSDQTDSVTDVEVTPLEAPALSIDKPAPVNGDEDGSGDVSAGDTLTYTITATNSGAANLTDVVVSDNLITPTGGTTPCALVGPTETCTLVGTYTVTAADVAAGSITNEATANSDQTDSVTDDEVTPVPAPALSIDKPAPVNGDEDGSGDVSEGDTLVYTITATNNGATNLTNVLVTDDLITPTGGTTPCALVAPTETCTLVGTYVVTAADIAAGSITNLATADSDQTDSVTDDDVTTLETPALSIDKPAPVNTDEDGSGDVSEGDTLVYTITATNNGATNLTNVLVTDDLITPTGGTTPCALVAPTETCTLVGTYGVTAADIAAGSITNLATAGSDQTESVTDDEVTPVDTPALTTDKPAPVNADEDGSGDVSEGDTLTYFITATNSGDANLTNIVVTDDLITPTGGTTPCALVAPTDTCTLVGTYVVTAGDIAAGSITNTATADSDQTEPDTDGEVTSLETPALTVDKPAPVNADEDGSGDISVGDTLAYTITATNNGATNLTNVIVTDDLITPTGGTTPCALVAPGETCTLAGSYTVTSTDVAAGSITNTATADSDQTGQASDDEVTPILPAGLAVDKPAPVNSDEDGSGDVSEGDTLTYTITATNNGATNLTNVIVTDDLITPTGGTAPCALVAPTETCTLVGTYTVTAADVTAGSITNTATADSDQTGPADVVEVTSIESPDLTVDKPAPVNSDEDGSGDVSEGDTLTYTITATNNGASNLTDVIVTDDLITPTGGTAPCALVAPTETCTLVGTYTVSAADVTAGSITNTATADSDQTGSITDGEITLIDAPGLGVDKPVPTNADEDGSGDVSVGDTLTYTITATNSGDANLTNVAIIDDLITPTGGTAPCAILAPGGACTLVGSYVVTVNDVAVGSIFNTATADSDQTGPVDDDQTTVVPSPLLEVLKPAPTNADDDGSGDVSEGDTLTYTITATNTGTSVLTNVVLSDDLITPTAGTTPCASLAPGGSCTLVGTYVVTSVDVATGAVTNSATADSDQTGPTIDGEVTSVAQPGLNVDKPEPTNSDEDRSGDVSAGDTLTYTITATNTGGATLTNVVVADILLSPTAGTTPCALVPPGGTCTLVGTYIVTEDDAIAGTLPNTATADSDQTGTASDEVNVPIAGAELEIDKPAPVNADEDGSGDVSVGDTLSYTITATNTGDANLSDVSVVDDLITPTGGSTPCALLLPGETCTLEGTYLVSPADTAAGSIFNTATADSAQTDSVSDTDTTPVPAPALVVDKPAPANADEDGSGDVSVGDTLTYTITATNTGASTLTAVSLADDLITPTGGSTPCAAVAPTDTCTLVGTYVVTESDVAAGVILNTASGDSDQTEPTSDDEATTVPTPRLVLDKPTPLNADEDGSGDVSVGDTLTYTITATNTGGAALTNLVMTDALITPTGGTAPCAIVLPGGTCVLVGSYVVTPADVVAGSIENTATAGSDQTNQVPAGETTPVLTPGIVLVKPAPVNADEDGSGDVSVGDTLTYTITATNTGDATLTNVIVSDDVITTSGGSTPCATLAPAETCTLIGTYVVNAGDVGAGTISNTATVVSDQTQPVSDSELTTVPAPALSVVKPLPANADEDGSGDVSVGDTLTFTITATNDGATNLTNVVVSDDLVTVVGGTSPCASILPTETCTLVGTYVVGEADVVAGSIFNTANADSDQTEPSPTDVTVPVQTPSLGIDKPAPVNADEDGSGDVSAGDTLTFTITATNSSGANLTNVAVTDDRITAIGGTAPCAIVAPTETCTLVGTYVVTESDVALGSMTNTATGDSDQTNPVTDDHVTPLLAPQISVDKPQPVNADEDGSGDVSAGDTLTYTVTVTNSGGSTLTDLTVADPLITPVGGTTPCALVAPGETCTLVGTYEVTAVDVAARSADNTATGDSDQTGPGTDDVTTPIPLPELLLDKPAPVNADEDGSGDVSLGDTLTYTITATNDGSANLTTVQITDDLLTTTGGSTPCALLAPGETCTLVGTYSVSLDDVLAGAVTNTATAESDQGDPATATEITPVAPVIGLLPDKPAPTNIDEDGSGDVSQGDTLTYTITARNTGTAPLTNVVIVDDLIDQTGGTSPCAVVPAGGSCTLIGTYVVDADDVVNGEVVNTATAASDDTETTSATVTVPVAFPVLTVDKPEPVNIDEDGSGDVSVGDTLTYVITATNEGGAALTNVVVTDSQLTQTGGTSPCERLISGSTCTLIGTYVVTADDQAAGQVVNSATAGADQTDLAEDSVTVPVLTPELVVDKAAPTNADEDGNGEISIGDTLTYTVTATNTGSSALTSVVVADERVERTGGNAPCALLLPGETCTLVGTYVVTAADSEAGRVTNSATADSDQTSPVEDEVTVSVLNDASLSLVKPAPSNGDQDSSGTPTPGDVLTYTITATNDGRTSLTNVVVTDTLITVNGGTSPCEVLAPGETCTLVGTYTVTRDDASAQRFVNNASASSDQTAPSFAEVTIPIEQTPVTTPQRQFAPPIASPNIVNPPTVAVPPAPEPAAPLATTGNSTLPFVASAAALFFIGSAMVIGVRRSRHGGTTF